MEHENKFDKIKQKPNLAVVGCSYSHYADGNCLFKSYPAYIAENFPDWNVVDLSSPGSSNDSAYLRLFNFEHNYKIKFDKVIFQITHFDRLIYFNRYSNLDQNLWTHVVKNNYFYTENDGQFYENSYLTMSSTIGLPDRPPGNWNEYRRKKISKWIGLKEKYIVKCIMGEFLSNKSIWHCQKEINLINATYGSNNVLVYSWHKGIDKGKNLKSEIFFPKNWKKSMEERLTTDKFWKLSIDDAGHFDDIGHLEAYKALEPDIKNLIKG